MHRLSSGDVSLDTSVILDFSATDSNKVSGVRNADLVSDLLVGLIGSAEQVSCPLKPQFHRVLADTDTKLDSVPDSSDILIYTDP